MREAKRRSQTLSVGKHYPFCGSVLDVKQMKHKRANQLVRLDTGRGRTEGSVVSSYQGPAPGLREARAQAPSAPAGEAAEWRGGRGQKRPERLARKIPSSQALDSKSGFTRQRRKKPQKQKLKMNWKQASKLKGEI